MTRSPDRQSKSTSTHERLSDNETVKGSSDRSFGLVFAAVFTIIGLWPLISSSGGGDRGGFDDRDTLTRAAWDRVSDMGLDRIAV